jgi:hypothetical protein
MTPAELIEFDPEEWADPVDSSWSSSFERWCDARRVWAAEHPDSLGNAMEMFRKEFQTRYGKGDRTNGEAS